MYALLFFLLPIVILVKKMLVAILDFTDVKNVTEGREGGDQARFFIGIGKLMH